MRVEEMAKKEADNLCERMNKYTAYVRYYVKQQK